ncbi:hypothetical protein yc1106_08796 [Curvularia clavata]|uniref:Uncharacterized protein n=1 Tax=Curvularia clavata TaxID=95742 RepID=A0A9Q8ZDY2_CURCL|nr:hypothetical protein yc1106_08796 [Curvularia clavata]
MTSQGGTSYTAVPRRNSDSRMSLDDIPLATRFQSHSDHEHKHPRESMSDEDEPDPRATKVTSNGHAVSLTDEHEKKGDMRGVRPVQWRISLYTPIAMVSLFVSGLLVAVGHHLFYSRFNGTRVRGPKEDGASEYISQVWIIRYGTAFAFVTKTLLAGSIVVAYKQHMWINLRHKANSVSTIDAVFAATHDFLAFLSPSFWTRAKIPALLALIAWCLPLAALVTPSSLTVIGAKQDTVSPTSVPALNLNDSALYRSEGLGNATSPLLHRTTLATAMSMQILPMRRILPVNASYEFEFEGPSLKCETATGDRLQNMTAVDKETIRQLKTAATGRTSVEADMRYLSFASDETGISTDNLTSYVLDCIVLESFNPCGTSSPVPTLFIRMGNESITCTTYNTHFTALFGAMGALDTQPISNVRHEWKEPLNTDVTRSIFKALSSLLNGFFGTYTSSVDSDGRFSGKTMIADTALLELLQQSFPALRNDIPQEKWMQTISTQSLAQTVEELSRNQTMSLFSIEALWLPLDTKDSKTMANVHYWDVYNKYEYLPRNLWLAYGFAIACSFTAVLLGLRALWLNGVSHDNSFSAIMAVTRNKYLDQLTWGHSLGAAPMGEEILKARLKFGVLEGSDDGDGGGGKGMYRAGFGTDDTVGRLRKWQVVY